MDDDDVDEFVFANNDDDEEEEEVVNEELLSCCGPGSGDPVMVVVGSNGPIVIACCCCCWRELFELRLVWRTLLPTSKQLASILLVLLLILNCLVETGAVVVVAARILFNDVLVGVAIVDGVGGVGVEIKQFCCDTGVDEPDFMVVFDMLLICGDDDVVAALHRSKFCLWANICRSLSISENINDWAAIAKRVNNDTLRFLFSLFVQQNPSFIMKMNNQVYVWIVKWLYM